MSYRKFFTFAHGLLQSIRVPIGTCQQILDHVEYVTHELELVVEQYRDNPPQWTQYSPPKEVCDEIACDVVFAHNRFVRKLYHNLARWSNNPPEEYEEMTPEFAQSIWYGLSMLHIPHDRWTEDAYIEEMEVLFEVMQGNEKNGIIFDADALTPQQACAVITLFAVYLDKADVRLKLPNNHDALVPSEEYYWCSKHGAWLRDDVEEDDEGNVICPADGCEEVLG